MKMPPKLLDRSCEARAANPLQTDESFVRPVVLPVGTVDTGMVVARLKVLIFGANLIFL